MGCLVVFEGMKAASRSCAKGSQTLLKGSTLFKIGLVDFAGPTGMHWSWMEWGNGWDGGNVGFSRKGQMVSLY